MSEIAALHSQRQAATTQSNKDAIRQQIMEKQQLLSTHTPSALASSLTSVPQSSVKIDANDDRIRERIANMGRQLLAVPRGPKRDAFYAKIRVLRNMLSSKAKVEHAAKSSYKRKMTQTIVIADDDEPKAKKGSDPDVTIISETS